MKSETVFVVRHLAEAEVFSTQEIADAFALELTKVEKGHLPEAVRRKDIDAKAGWVAMLLYYQGIEICSGELHAPRKFLWMVSPQPGHLPAWEAHRTEGVITWIAGFSLTSAEEARQKATLGRETYLREEKGDL